MPDITMLAGAGIFLAGMVTGRTWPSRRRKVKPVKPICGCKHHHSFHDPDTGACYGKATEAEYNVIGGWIGEHKVPCTCRKYSGPEPLPELFAPEIGAS